MRRWLAGKAAPHGSPRWRPSECRSDLAGVVCPMQQRLPLPAPAQEIAGLAVFLHLAHVPFNRLPALDLSCILIRQTAAHVVAAIPLEPSARIVRVDPAFASPFGQRLACVDPKEIACVVATAGSEFGADEPAFRELTSAISHVFAAEYAEFEHLWWRELRLELGIEVPAGCRAQHVAIAFLHLVVVRDSAL